MNKHVKIYMSHFDFVYQEEIPCEACGSPAVDVHHINGRGKGKDVIGNLMALCRKCHDRATTSKNYVPPAQMQYIHNYYLTGRRKQFLK